MRTKLFSSSDLIRQNQIPWKSVGRRHTRFPRPAFATWIFCGAYGCIDKSLQVHFDPWVNLVLNSTEKTSPRKLPRVSSRETQVFVVFAYVGALKLLCIQKAVPFGRGKMISPSVTHRKPKCSSRLQRLVDGAEPYSQNCQRVPYRYKQGKVISVTGSGGP
jgi:hypothetical protein